jgi:LysR family nitrogen assimilation transcriptional regulator
LDVIQRGQAPFTIRQLSYFIALAEHGSISAAASSLKMAQPSLSDNIAKLESQLDIQLVLRGARGIRLTESGQFLAMRGREILRHIDQTVGELRELSGEPRGPVTIGLTPSLSIVLAVPLLETVNAEYPDIRMSLSDAMSSDVLEWVANERVEIGCVYDARDSAVFAIEPLLTEQVFLVTAPDNWAGPIGPNGIALDPIKASELSQYPLVLTSASHGARMMQEKFARSVGVQLNVVAAIDSLPQIVEMVSRASAYTLTSHGAVVKQVAEGKLALVPIVEPALIRTAYLVRKRSRPLSRGSIVVEKFIKLIVSEMVQRYGIDSAHPESGNLEPTPEG